MAATGIGGEDTAVTAPGWKDTEIEGGGSEDTHARRATAAAQDSTCGGSKEL